MTEKLIVGMDPRLSINVYPRLDRKFEQRGSLNFDLARTKIFRNRPEPPRLWLLRYKIYALIGVGTGLATVLITELENALFFMKVSVTNNIIGGAGNNLAWGFVFFLSVSVVFGFAAAVLVVYLAPSAAHSGTVEMMSYLNGVNNNDWFGLEMFFVKATAIILAGASGLCVGKTGTFPHIGAMIGLGAVYLPFRDFDFFHVDYHKREFVSAGLACGMAVAFGAPIGGTLFGYEISQPNFYYQYNNLWRTFLTCTLGVIVYSFCVDLRYVGNLPDGWVLNSSPMRFQSITAPIASIQAIPSALIIGSLCGLIGAGFVASNTYVNMFRKQFYRHPMSKVGEVTLLAFITATYFYWFPYWAKAKCFPQADGYPNGLFIAQYNCPKAFFNPLATLFFNTEGGVLKAMASAFSLEQQQGMVIGTLTIFVFAACWFVFSMLTYGSMVPTGTFLSAILIGCSVGFFYENTRASIFDIAPNEVSSLPVIIGAASMIAGYTRLTYSVVLLVLEACDSFNLAIPMFIAVWASNCVGNLLTTSLYERELRGKQMPFLRGVCPEQNTHVKMSQVIRANPVTIPSVADMKSIKKALESGHGAFPVLNTAGNLVGLLPLNILCELVRQKCFYDKSKLSLKQRQQVSTVSMEFQQTSQSDQPGQDQIITQTSLAYTEKAQGSSNIGKDTFTRSQVSMAVTEHAPNLGDQIGTIQESQTSMAPTELRQVKNNFYEKSVSSLGEYSTEDMVKFDPSYDHKVGFFPETDKRDVLDWRCFNPDINSRDTNPQDMLEEMLASYLDELVDVRPYMWEYPFTVSVQDSLEKGLSIFVVHHLRHLCVVHPVDGSVAGVVTRKDLFRFCHL